MSLALSLFLQCGGKIRARYLITEQTKINETEQKKQEEKEYAKRFRADFENDILSTWRMPRNRLGRFLLHNFRALPLGGRLFWLEMWYFNLYPKYLYETVAPTKRRRIPPPRKNAFK